MYWQQVSIKDRTFDLEPLYYQVGGDHYNSRLLLLFKTNRTHLYSLSDDTLLHLTPPLPFKVLDVYYLTEQHQYIMLHVNDRETYSDFKY